MTETEHTGYSFFQGNTMQKLYQNNLQFFDNDIYQHFSRIYLLGQNTYDSPWKLPTTPPVSLKPRLFLSRYVEFANGINRKTEWSKWEDIAYRAIKFIYPAMAAKFLYWRRDKHCSRFVDMVHDKVRIVEFWKNEEERMRDHIQIKFSFSNQI